MVQSNYTPPVVKTKLNWPSEVQKLNEVESTVGGEPLVTTLGIEKTKSGWQLVEVITQGDKVVSKEFFQSELKSNVMDQFKFRSLELFEKLV